MMLMMEAHFRCREIVDPGNLKVSAADTVLFSVVKGDGGRGSVEGAPPEVQLSVQL